MEDNEFLEKMGKRIADLRKAKGWTQEEFSKMIDVKRSALARIEVGRVNCSINSLRRMAASLDLKLEKLLKVD